MKSHLRALLAALALAASAASAQQLIPTNVRLHEDLNWLANRNIIKINLSTWPLSADEIRHALDNAQPATVNDAEIVQKVRQYIDADNNRLKLSAHITAQNRGERPLLPIGMNQPRDQYGVAAGGHFGTEKFDLNVQAAGVGGDTLGRNSHLDLSETYAGLKIGNQWLSLGQQSRYWGPAHEGSLILGDSARPFVALNLQRGVQKPFQSKWLSWLGKWNYQMFVGQQLDKENMRSPRHTKLMGMRVTLSPTDYLDLGLSRTAQWGGQGRPQNWKALGNAILARGDNTYTAEERRKEPGNQLAGFDVKLKLQPLVGAPVSVYGQMIGEDEANKMPSKNFFLAGIDGSHKVSEQQTLNWHLEGADTSTKFGKLVGVTYRHHLYQDGYYQQNLPLGHPLGGDVRSVVLGINSSVFHNDNKKWFKTHHFGGKLMHAQTVRKNKDQQTSVQGASVAWEGDVNTKNRMNMRVGANGWYAKPEQGKVQSGVGVKTSLSF
ncbi:capsule assembly Wzi family protein [Conchiformibius kuhniae]|uniref:Capsule assembly Wzi family protein n=1 Tax=Conchiformibius kuhniae TaxID=211502 RepID=A0A8T9MXJ9_9NEIS|nr:capsule assembly Wzi family protein [Conchiformibius kuhniae]